MDKEELNRRLEVNLKKTRGASPYRARGKAILEADLFSNFRDITKENCKLLIYYKQARWLAGNRRISLKEFENKASPTYRKKLRYGVELGREKGRYFLEGKQEDIIKLCKEENLQDKY